MGHIFKIWGEKEKMEVVCLMAFVRIKCPLEITDVALQVTFKAIRRFLT